MINGRSIFSFLLVVVMAIFSVYSLKYNPTARSIPLAVGNAVLIMAFIQLLSDALPSFSQRIMSMISKNKPKAVEMSEDDEIKWSKVSIIFIWLIGFTFLLHWTSYLVAVPVFLLLFIWKVGKAPFIPSLGVAFGMLTFMYVLFDVLLGARF
ncbi:tripartite tricarboxylate transporter TctB family protein [Ammoniphilus sp. YIM 78166]|uniref:tripartite tricarboxylate transporter TctB family protein n=1 Tax=Ammoniphilus sp. YIM 78166 TaxID=1644106 RepID=UPI00106F7F02|nr:tripartite tricarboxylate transporter TctB family protein [Ammoniphilus sp. YIM 78166]